MTIDECIEALEDIKDSFSDESGGDIDLVLGAEFDETGKLTNLSLNAEPFGEEGQVIFEEPFLGDQPSYRSK